MAPKSGRSKKARNMAYSQVPALQPGQAVMRVVGVRGNNLYDVHHQVDGTKDHLDVVVLELPKRLRQLVFIRPGCYVFARLDASRGTGSIVRGDIEEVVLDKFLGSLEKADFWPAIFLKSNAAGKNKNTSTNKTKVDDVVEINSLETPQDDNGDEEEEELDDLDDDWIGQGNPNRASWLQHEESSSEEEEEEEDPVKKSS